MRHPNLFSAVPAAVVLLLAGCVTPRGATVYNPSLDSLTPADWKADLEYLKKELSGRSRHPDPFHNTGSRERFDEACRAAAAALEVNPSLDGKETADLMVTGISRMLTALGEGHTALNAYPGTLFPVGVRWFLAEPGAGAPAAADPVSGLPLELRVVKVPPSCAAFLGAKITGIGGRPLAEALSLIREVISADHPGSYQAAEPRVITNPRLMRGLGLADGTRLTLEAVNGDGTGTFSVEETASSSLELVSPVLPTGGSLALPRTNADPLWFAEASPGVLYVSYDDCSMKGFAFFWRVLRELKEKPYTKLVLDLRDNPGGNSLPGTWFASRLRSVPALRKPGAVRVLIGPRTFSSAMMLAADVMEAVPAVFAGQAVAEPVDSWGEVKRFALPRSGLVVGHSTKFFRYSRGKSLRLTEDGLIVPDAGFTRIPTYDEWVSGEDPVLDLAVAFGE